MTTEMHDGEVRDEPRIHGMTWGEWLGQTNPVIIVPADLSDEAKAAMRSVAAAAPGSVTWVSQEWLSRLYLPLPYEGQRYRAVPPEKASVWRLCILQTRPE